MKIFLISPVRNIDERTQQQLEQYVKSLEDKGYKVHWPLRDTDQVDATGGFEICRANCLAILESDEVHIWYDDSSSGSKFDIGVVFTLVEMLAWRKKMVIANPGQFEVPKGKSFYRVIEHMIKKQER